MRTRGFTVVLAVMGAILSSCAAKQENPFNHSSLRVYGQIFLTGEVEEVRHGHLVVRFDRVSLQNNYGFAYWEWSSGRTKTFGTLDEIEFPKPGDYVSMTILMNKKYSSNETYEFAHKFLNTENALIPFSPVIHSSYYWR